MTPVEVVEEILSALSEEFKLRLFLDDSGFITLEWGGAYPVTVYAPGDGESYVMASVVGRLTPESPTEAVLRWLLEMNMPGASAANISFASLNDAVIITGSFPAAADRDKDVFKRHISEFMLIAAHLGDRLRDFIQENPAERPAVGQPLPRVDSEMNAEELIRANIMNRRV